MKTASVKLGTLFAWTKARDKVETITLATGTRGGRRERKRLCSCLLLGANESGSSENKVTRLLG